ncbi:DUF3560 domain-containing protein [Sphaerisporangium sp. NPDC004334]
MADVTIQHTHADGTLIEGSVKGDGVYEIVKPFGFRYFPSIGMIGIRGSRDRPAKRYAINGAAEALREAGHEVRVEIDDEHRDRAQVLADQAERLEDRRDALAAKAGRHAGKAAAAHQQAHDLSERFAGGQPILAGHHSERGARRDKERMDAAMRRSVEHDEVAQDAARRANAVGRNARHSARPGTTARRIKTTEAELRRIQRGLDGYERVFRRHDGTVYYVETHHPATGDHREQLLARKAQLQDQLAYDQAQLAAAVGDGAFIEFGKHNVHVGDRVWAWGYNGLASKTNPTTVRVEFRDHWAPKVAYTDIKQVECRHGDKPVIIAPSPRPATEPAPRKVEVAPVDTAALQKLKEAPVVVARGTDAFMSTPLVVDHVMSLAGIGQGTTVLEPSAGTGMLARAAAELGAVVDCVEQHAGMAARLFDVPGVRGVTTGDFLEVSPSHYPDRFDRVVMNPPFSGGKDIMHVTHALRFAAPGGLVVAVMAAGVTFSTTRAATSFRDQIEQRGGRFEELPDDAFAPMTGVRTVIAVIPC